MVSFTRRHSFGIIHHNKVTVSLIRRQQFHSPDTTVMISSTRHASHGFIHQTRQLPFHSRDTTVTISLTRDTAVTSSFTWHHTHGFTHQTPQQRFHSPDATVTVSFTRCHSHGSPDTCHLPGTPATILFTKPQPWLHSSDIMAKISFTWHNSHGFISPPKTSSFWLVRVVFLGHVMHIYIMF